MSIEEVGDLSAKEIELLWNAAKDPDGFFLHFETLWGEGISNKWEALSRRHGQENGSRIAGWVPRFEDRGLIESFSEELKLFRANGRGYAIADELKNFTSWNTSSILLMLIT